MAQTEHPSRRGFLVGSVAIAGGVAFGTYSFARGTAQGAPNPLLTDLAPNSVTFNPWIKISPDKITLITPHVDFGQGVVHVQAALIAEEMDIEFGQFETEYGLPNKAYANTGQASETIPFRATDKSPEAREALAAAIKGIEESGLQATGGSSSVRDSFYKLRMAGAVARETLKAAAARRTGIEASKLRSNSGAVVLPGGTRIPYVALAAEAAGIAPVQDVVLRRHSQWRLLGKPMKRLDMEPKVAGSLKFGIDQTVPGMVYAAVKMNPHKLSDIASYDASNALKMRGVLSVLKIKSGVAAIATNSWYAMKAAEAVECRWEKPNYPLEQAEHWAALEESFVPNKLDKVWRDDGDVDSAMSKASVINAEYRAPYLAHQPLEPLSGVAIVSDDGAEIWCCSQFQSMIPNMVAQITGLKPEQVKFHNQWTGGSFGHRGEFALLQALADTANQMRGTPVKLTFSREEDFRQDIPRQIAMCRPSGVVKNGAIIAIDFPVASTSVIRSQFRRLNFPVVGADSQIPQGIWSAPYAIPNFRMTAYIADGLSPVASWRSVGASVGGFFSECFIDELIHDARLDPLQARIDMCDFEPYRQVLEALKEMSNWKGPLGSGKGRGVALVEAMGVPVGAIVQVSQTDRGIKLDKVWIAADVGRVVDPVNFQNQLQGGVIFGLGHAMNCELTYAGGVVQQTNYHAHQAMRLYQCPEIETRGLENREEIFGIGEPPVAVAAPALGNAIFAATGRRIREMPFNKFIDFI